MSIDSPDGLPFSPFYTQAPAPQVDPLFHSSTQAPPFQHHLLGSVSSQSEMMNFIPAPYLQMPDQADRAVPRSYPANYQQIPISGVDSLFSGLTTMPPSSSPSSFSGQSPKLIDLLIPGTDLNARPAGFLGYQSNLEMAYQPPSQSEILPSPAATMDQDVDFDEEIVRDPQETPGQWAMRLPSPSPSTSSASSGGSPPHRMRAYSSPFAQPRLPENSPEMLMVRFDRQTCGILSIKDGPNENPWRTLVWPLARESPALYHAVSSMTAFHLSRERASLRVDGMEHMRKSIRALAAGIENMRTDAALATTLALAFSESWDQHISTGIEHLRGARVLVDQAVIKHKQHALSGEDLARLKFLCNTFVYMDVIARLTSDDEDEVSRSDSIVPQYCGPFSEKTEIDPLMGCATSLFPLIGCVANLARRIRKSKSTTVLMIEQGMELKTQIENWKPGTLFDPPEDPTSDIQHCIQTAEAYRWATLLYLHQALPEIPSMTTVQLAKKVLVYLATVPIQSRTIIIHIYPLLIAGCEAVGDEREWVKNRWEAMIQRLAIGNVDKCWDITKEVWERRDKDQMERARTQSPANDSTRSNSPTLQVKRKYEEEEEGINSPYRWQQSSYDFLSCKKRATSGDRGSPKASTMDSKARSSLVDAYTEEYMDYDMTVRGRLHWAGVMKEWKWEGESLNVEINIAKYIFMLIISQFCLAERSALRDKRFLQYFSPLDPSLGLFFLSFCFSVQYSYPLPLWHALGFFGVGE
jgi:Fungal specific transcription factor domain